MRANSQVQVTSVVKKLARAGLQLAGTKAIDDGIYGLVHDAPLGFGQFDEFSARLDLLPNDRLELPCTGDLFAKYCLDRPRRTAAKYFCENERQKTLFSFVERYLEGLGHLMNFAVT